MGMGDKKVSISELEFVFWPYVVETEELTGEGKKQGARTDESEGGIEKMQLGMVEAVLAHEKVSQDRIRSKSYVCQVKKEEMASLAKLMDPVRCNGFLVMMWYKLN